MTDRDMVNAGAGWAVTPPFGGGVGGGVARDAFGYSLHYYEGDYTPKAAASAPTFLADASGSALAAATSPLYNGNISRMVTTLSALSNSPIVGAAYRYDRLNRLTRAVQHGNITYDSGYKWGETGHTTDSESDYYADYTYDSNGNLRQLRRNAHGTANAMDDLFYFYKAHNNQLTHVTDAVTGAPFASDLPSGQAADNYTYDLDGNLISDDSEEIEAIHWNASGKVTRVERTSASTRPDLLFLYDALGNRYGKVSSVGDAPISEADITMYIRDAQGNPLEIYDYSFEDLGDNEYRESLKLNERIFYGSSRIATETDINEEVAFAEFSVDSEDYPYEGDLFAKLNVSTTFVDPDPKKFSLMRGRKHYELTNHLGNVLATVSDKRFPIDGKYSWVLGAAGTGDYNFVDGAFVYDAGNGNYTQDEAPDGEIDFYMPKVTMANRYYPFGMVQPNSDNISGNTRFGFNGHEMDNEVKPGKGNHLSFGDNGYDSRLAKRWNIDPMFYKYPYLSPYSFSAGNPILFNDVTGNDFFVPKKSQRKAVMRVLNQTFGKGHGFDFNKESGQLMHNGVGYLGSREQQIVFDNFREKIVENENVHVEFEGFGRKDMVGLDGTPHDLMDEGSGGLSGIINGIGGLAYTSQLDIGGKLHAKIALGPRLRNVIYSEEGVFSNKATVFWHEMGHPMAQVKSFNGTDVYNTSYRGKANEYRWSVGFENIVRDIFGMQRRSGSAHAPEKKGPDGKFEAVPGASGTDPSDFDIYDRRPLLPSEPGGGVTEPS